MPNDSPPPSSDLSWEELADWESNGNVSHRMLCRTIRLLCAERDARLDEAARLLAAVTIRDAQLSAYVTAAEGREAGGLIPPSGVERIGARLHEAEAQLAEARYKPKLAEYEQVQRAYYEQVRSLNEQLAERDAEIARLKEEIADRDQAERAADRADPRYDP